MIDLQEYNITKPENIKALFEIILKIVTTLYNDYAPNEIKNRRNKKQSKMTDPEIISIKLLIEMLKKSELSGYSFLKNNFSELVNYIDRTRFNRTIRNLTILIRHIRKKLKKKFKKLFKKWNIVDSFPVAVCKFGRKLFTKLFRDISSFGYCASKKEVYYGFKVHLLVDIDGNPIDYIVTKANVDDRDGMREIAKNNEIDTCLGDKGYVGSLESELYNEYGIKFIAIKKKNTEKRLSKQERKALGIMRRRVETTISQLVEIFDIEKVRAKSVLGIQAGLESKLLAFNLLVLINKGLNVDNPLKIANLIYGY